MKILRRIIGFWILAAYPFTAIGQSTDALSIDVPAAVGMDAQRLAVIDTLAEAGIEAGETPGCVVLVARRGKIVFRRAYGRRQVEPSSEPMALDTIFDMASITKPVATATSVMLLVEQGKIGLHDPVVNYLPELTGGGKEAITIFQLLTHQGGLVPDNSLDDYQHGPVEAWRRICALETVAPPGTRFTYTDVGFIILGQLVERVSGISLHDFSRTHIFDPLGMVDTGFLPSVAVRSRCAATERRDGQWLKGVVHDPRSALLGGVAGHAGLFSTAGDLARYAQMMLQQGTLGGQQILSPDTVQAMTAPYDVCGIRRGLGWDKQSPYSSNRGDLLTDRSFGHGGFTGTVLWIDPGLELCYVFLGTRLHPDGEGTINPLAQRIGTLVAASVIDQPVDMGTSPVLTGIDVLRRDGFGPLTEGRVGLITNHTGVTRDGESTARVLQQSSDVDLVALFSPEHGRYGALDVAEIDDTVDEETGLPVYSLYGGDRSPTATQLREIDVLAFDIQDIGTRYYTYISTMGLAMEAASQHHKRFVVLDRPNPIGGVVCSGPMRDSDRESFVAYHPLPVRHGMTVGELARMFRAERGWNVDLRVVAMEGWHRADLWDDTELSWVNPSPNMRNLTQALLYPGVGWMEGTNLSVGRGTDTPFEVIGAPWINGRRLARELNHAGLAGIRFVPIQFTPDSSKFAHERCSGIQILVTDRRALQPMRAGLTIAHGLRQLHPVEWQTDALVRLLANQQAVEDLLHGTPPDVIEFNSRPGLGAFQQRRMKFLMYDSDLGS